MSEIFESVEKTNVKINEEEQETIKVEQLRSKHREQKLAYREEQRGVHLRKARSFDDEAQFGNYVDEDIRVLAKRLKNKSQVSCELLHAVMNVLLDSEDNITEFLKVDGALQALLRLLSGHNEKFQLVAAQCICNLALGNKKQSMQILKAAESYLMVHLSGKNIYVTEVCAIALGNLGTQGVKNVQLLKKQGFLPKIFSLLGADQSLESAAIYALTQVVYHGFDILGADELESCLRAILPIFNKRSTSVAFLMSVLSSTKSTHEFFILNGVHIEVLKCLLASLRKNEKEVVYFLRILSNLLTEDAVAKDLVETQSHTVRECIRCLLQSEKKYLKRECLGFLGNFINSSTDAKYFGIEMVKENFVPIELYVKKLDV